VCLTNQGLTDMHIHFVDVGPPSDLGATLQCGDSQELKYAALAINADSGIDWFKGSGLVDPSTDFDLWGVATHEFGHATGTWFGNNHMPSGECGSGLVDRPTMCAGTSAGDVKWRTLEAHDKSTFQHAY